MSQVCYVPSKFKFNSFFNHVKDIEFKHKNLPERFLDTNSIKDVVGNPIVSFQISAEEINPDIFVTYFTVSVKYAVSGSAINKEKNCQEPKEYEIYNFNLSYVAFTHIENSKDISEIDRKKILLIDVPYLAFPAIKFFVYNFTKDAGSTPVSLNQIDFAGLFEEENNKLSESINRKNSTDK